MVSDWISHISNVSNAYSLSTELTAFGHFSRTSYHRAHLNGFYRFVIELIIV